MEELRVECAETFHVRLLRSAPQDRPDDNITPEHEVLLQRHGLVRNSATRQAAGQGRAKMLAMEEIPASFFISHNDGYIATILSRGPWDDNSAHGGPVAALIGRTAERFDPDPELATVRLTIELLRPVPLSFLRFDTTMLRPGKRVRLIGVSITSDGVEVARAVVLRIRRTPLDITASLPESGGSFASPEASHPAPVFVENRVGISNGVEIRSVTGVAFLESGPSVCWFRVGAPLVDDEAITPLTRALIAADFGNGIASVVPLESHLFINPELTVHLFRLPEGEWIANDARTWLDPGGNSVAEATLADRKGPMARAMQSLYVAAR